MTFEDLTYIGGETGALLKARGQSIAVVDGATGGLISAALLAMPGAS
ncbi:MAG: CinA family protein, partial [Novosphingobium sp.]